MLLRNSVLASSWKSESPVRAQVAESWRLPAHCKVHFHAASLTDKSCEELPNLMLTHLTSLSFFFQPCDLFYQRLYILFYFNLLCRCLKEKVLVHKLWNSGLISIITVWCLTTFITFISWTLYYFRRPCFHKLLFSLPIMSTHSSPPKECHRVFNCDR